MSECQLTELISRLNGKDTEHRLSAEWEIAVLSALNKLGKVSYEPRFAGTRLVDVLFSVAAEEALADITTVSDAGLHDENPVNQLADELVRQLRKRRVDPNRFHLQVEGNWRELFLGGPKPRLRTPRVNEFRPLIFNRDFAKFVTDIKSNPGQKRSFTPQARGQADITISYDPTQSFFGCGHLSYEVPFKLENNPIYNRLQKKATQLRDSGYAGRKGIIVCDGGCWALNRQSRRGMDYGADEIISNFLKKNTSIAFVQTLVVVGDGTRRLGPDHFEIVGRTYTRQANDLPEAIKSPLLNIPRMLPRPETTPVNAYTNRSEGNSFYGGLTLSDRTIKISVRSLLEVLAGRVPQQKFLQDHGLLETPLHNFFEKMLREGRLLSEVKLEHCPTHDDDWINFSFSDSDPAISPITYRKV